MTKINRQKQAALRKRKTAERSRVREADRVARQTYIPTNLRRQGNHPGWYQEYLKTPHWIAFKLRYKVSSRPQHCVICNNPKYELHHRTYEKTGYEQLDDVVALCRAHHARAHRNEKNGIPLWDAHL